MRRLVEACEEEESLTIRLLLAGESKVTTGQIGPYALDRLLGRGGMGAVYLAHRTDGHYDQQVAIKMIDLPLAGDLFRERFRMERQILAGLTHPFIARLLDGGVSEQGEMYLVMEYVEGVSIVRYCKENRLPLRDRLVLFQHVCDAVQYAHRNLVIHRDLKPDNILVTGDGTPRLLDFGTAKLVVPEPAAGELTLRGVQSYTPQYASPEQVLGRPVTTVSDTYSLGVLLYIMLAEVPPYTLEEFTTEEIVRVICTEDVPKPSSVAVSAEPPDADLDAIVLKALRKEESERYLTVDYFSADIQTYLEGLPVAARKGSLRYSAGKFAKRNRLAIAGALALLMTLLAGVAGVLWQSRVANAERRRAEARSQQLRQLSNSLLSEIDEAVKQLPGSTPVQQLLVQRALEQLDRMSQDAGDDKATQLDLVAAYTRLGNLQGNPYDQNIGDTAGALVSLDKASTIAQSLKGRYPKDAVVQGAFASVEKARSNVLFGVSRTQEAIASMRAAIEAFHVQLASPGATPAQFAEAAGAYNGLGDQLGLPGTASLGDSAGALAAYRQAVGLSRHALLLDPHFVVSSRALAIGYAKIGDIVIQTDPMSAAEDYRQSIGAWNSLLATGKGSANNRGLARATLKLGMALSAERDYKLALAAYDSAGETLRAYAAADPKDTRAQTDLYALVSNEAQACIDRLDPLLESHDENPRATSDRAIQLLKEAIATLEKILAVNRNNPIWTTNLAFEKVMLGTLERGEGATLAAAGISALRRDADAEHASIDVLDLTTSAMLTVKPDSLRDPTATVRYAERLVALTQRKNPNFLLTLARAYRAAGRKSEARTAAKEGLDLLPATATNASASRARVLLEAELHA